MNRIFRAACATTLLLFMAPGLRAAVAGERPSHSGATAAAAPEQDGASAPQPDETSRFRISGFATLGMVATGSRDVRFIRPSVNHPGGENPDFGPDTVIGVHGDISLGARAALVLQAISRESTLGSFDPRASLAFVSYALTPNVTVRMGRVRVPFFMLSETIDINYANPWIRPPTEVYSLNPFNELDGIDFLVRTGIGGVNIEIHPYYGSSILPIYQGGNSHLSNTRGLNISVTAGSLTLFAGHTESEFALKWSGNDFLALSAALNAVTPNAANILGKLSGNDGFSTFSALGAQWDDGRWLLIGEYTRLDSRRYTHDAHAWEVTVARRFGNFTPYLTLARHTEDKPVSTDMTGIPQIDDALRAFIASRNLSQRSVTLGTRWDFYRNTALKLEFNHARISGESWGSFFARDPMNARMRDRSINTIGVSVDVTF
ncbi:MAG: hypothetical protein LBF50_08265 [Azoarcus sp.]|jgi:hypothetical protein|nr:hypothetical protein [Azoarcus sp.]